jgi:hypothetical protein
VTLVRASDGYLKHFPVPIDLVVSGPNKVPLPEYFPHGFKSATRTLATIEKALASCEGAVIAGRIGRNALVLDIDFRNGGHENFARLEATLGPLPPTCEARTPTGGRHLWFQPVGFMVRGELAKSVELLRGNRGVILPPSRRAGGAYEWVNHPLRTPRAEFPLRWQEAARLPPEPKRTPSNEDPEVRERRARAWIAKADPAIAFAGGHARTMAVAVRIVRGFDLDRNTAFSVMGDWNANCDPPWSDYDLKRKINEAYRRGRMEFGAMLTQREARAA